MIVSVTSAVLNPTASPKRARPLSATLVPPLAAAILLISCAARELASLRNLGDIAATVGSWIASAVDAEHGILYRPLVSDIGYGGTRYAPLRTLVQAALLKATYLGPLSSAILISAMSTVVLLAGCYVLMRRLSVAKPTAIVMTWMILASNGVRASILAGMADPLAAALSIWGLAAICSKSKSSAAYAAIFFSLAAATKITSIFGLAAALIWLVSRKDFQRAAQCAAIWAISVVGLIIFFEWASDGRMLPVFRACAGGGAGLTQIAQAPVVFTGILYRFDPVAGAFWILAIFAILFARQANSLPAMLLLTTSVVTVLIYGSPGTDMNHLIDLQAAAVLCLAISLRSLPKLAPVVAILALCAALISLKDAWRIEREARANQISQALAVAGKTSHRGPILCENPLLPILDKEHPYMLDCFMFRVFTTANPSLATQLWTDLAHQKFRAVILCPVGGTQEWTHLGSFDYEALPHIQAHYDLADQKGRYFIFLPRPRS